MPLAELLPEVGGVELRAWTNEVVRNGDGSRRFDLLSDEGQWTLAESAFIRRAPGNRFDLIETNRQFARQKLAADESWTAESMARRTT